MITSMQEDKIQICPFCHSTLSGESIVRCSSCGTRHHRSCWFRHHRCSVFGCPGSIRRLHLFSFRMATGAMLVPLFILMIFSVLTASAASFEFGLHAGYLAIRSSMTAPVVLLTALLFCGFYTFYVEFVQE